MSAAHALPRSRRSALLLGGATVLGLWFGLRAPDVSPVSAPTPVVQAPVVQAPTVDEAADPPPDDTGPRRGQRP